MVTFGAKLCFNNVRHDIKPRSDIHRPLKTPRDSHDLGSRGPALQYKTLSTARYKHKTPHDLGSEGWGSHRQEMTCMRDTFWSNNLFTPLA